MILCGWPWRAENLACQLCKHESLSYSLTLLSQLAELAEKSKAAAAELGFNACVNGNIGDQTTPEGKASAERAVKRMVTRALEMEGSRTGEHDGV